MWPLDINALFQVGDWVNIKNSMYKRVRIAEYRGPLGGKGARVYKIRLRKKPLSYIEVREDQLEHFVEEPVPGE